MSIQIPRTEPPFVVLALAGGGEFTRLLTTDGTYRIWLDGEPAPESTYWWLSSFERENLIRWEKFGDGCETSMLTTSGLFLLKKRHREILGPPPAEPAVDCTDDLPAFDVDPLLEAEFRTLDHLHGQNGPTP